MGSSRTTFGVGGLNAYSSASSGVSHSFSISSQSASVILPQSRPVLRFTACDDVHRAGVGAQAVARVARCGAHLAAAAQQQRAQQRASRRRHLVGHVSADGRVHVAGWRRRSRALGPREETRRMRRLVAAAARSARTAHSAWEHAYVHEKARVHRTAKLAPGVVVQAGAHVGARCELGAGAVAGENVRIGEGTRLGPHASLENCVVGSNCIVHAGARIGADGFGFYVDGRTVRKKPQLLRVLIGNHVEASTAHHRTARRRARHAMPPQVGAGTCIDRGSWRDTAVGNHAKIDNLVQIGHNAHVGEGCMLCGGSALGGSSSLGDFSVLGGKAALADHVTVVGGVRIAAFSGVSKHILEPGDYAGFPAQPIGAWRRETAALRRVARGEADARARRLRAGGAPAGEGGSTRRRAKAAAPTGRAGQRGGSGGAGSGSRE